MSLKFEWKNIVEYDIGFVCFSYDVAFIYFLPHFPIVSWTKTRGNIHINSIDTSSQLDLPIVMYRHVIKIQNKLNSRIKGTNETHRIDKANIKPKDHFIIQHLSKSLKWLISLATSSVIHHGICDDRPN